MKKPDKKSSIEEWMAFVDQNEISFDDLAFFTRILAEGYNSQLRTIEFLEGLANGYKEDLKFRQNTIDVLRKDLINRGVVLDRIQKQGDEYFKTVLN
ncbi:MAG: hypothetical protein GXY59_07225 [Bacteroidales bacterium]|nr:hypothetical protein [Bacteroidales bacterium]